MDDYLQGMLANITQDFLRFQGPTTILLQSRTANGNGRVASRSEEEAPRSIQPEDSKPTLERLAGRSESDPTGEPRHDGRVPEASTIKPANVDRQGAATIKEVKPAAG